MQLEATSGPVSRAERRDQQMQRIQDAAKSCFVRFGFQGASMQQICTEAGMSPGALYRYFPSKESIVEAICEADRKQDNECFAAILGNASIVEGIVQAAMEHIQHVSREHNAPLFTEIRAEAMRNESVAHVMEQCRQQVIGAFRQQLTAAMERGEIAPVVGLDTVIATLMAVGEGMAMNDLPAAGIDLAEIETAVRAMTVGMLRPSQTNMN